MSVDLLNIARSGVLASQSQIGVTGNNITNVNTKGYHRQVAQQSALLPQNFGDNFYGTGSYVSDVKRIYNDFATRELRLGQSALSHAETSHSKLTAARCTALSDWQGGASGIKSICSGNWVVWWINLMILGSVVGY